MCAPSLSFPLPFPCGLCGIIAGLLRLQKSRLAKYALPPAHAVSAVFEPPFPFWNFQTSSFEKYPNIYIQMLPVKFLRVLSRVGTVLAFSVFFGFRAFELFIRVLGRGLGFRVLIY